MPYHLEPDIVLELDLVRRKLATVDIPMAPMGKPVAIVVDKPAAVTRDRPAAIVDCTVVAAAH